MLSREQQLVYCRNCTRQTFDRSHGIVCGLNGMPADFQDQCTDFVSTDPQKAELESIQQLGRLMQEDASKTKRFVNSLIDSVCLLGFMFIFFIILGMVAALVYPDALNSIDTDSKLLNYLISFIAGMVYFTMLEASTGRTIGKFVTGTKVVKEDGSEPAFTDILVRSLCRYIPFDFVSFLGDDANGWHDSMSKTKVILVKKQI